MGRHRIFMRGGRRELALAVARLEAADFERWLADGQRTRNRRFGLFVALSARRTSASASRPVNRASFCAHTRSGTPSAVTAVPGSAAESSEPR